MVSLRTKLAWQITALIIGMLLIGLAALWGLNGLNEDFSVALEGYQRLRSLYEVGQHVETARLLVSQNPSQVDRARLELIHAKEQFALSFPVSSSTGHRKELEQSMGRALAAAVDSGDSPDELDSSAIDSVLKPLVDLDVDNRAMIEATQIAAKNKRATTIHWMAALTIAALLLALAVGVAQYRAVMRPLQNLSAAVQKVATGSFGQRVTVSGTTEFAEMAAHFNRMAEELDGLYRDLRQKVDDKSRQLDRNQRLANVGLLAAGIAHEINNPLSIITAHAELSMLPASQPNDLSEDARQSLTVIYEEAFRCKRIVEKLLTLARPPQEQPQAVNLSQLARDTLAESAALPLFRERNVTFDSVDNDAQVLAQPGEMKQVIMNLLFNALEATEPGMAIHLHLSRSNAIIELTITDEGRGMTQEMIDRLFEPFFTDPRGKHLASDSAPRGTGLGLSITYAIIQRLGGEITAQSAGSGKGSTFIVRLPHSTGPAASNS